MVSISTLTSVNCEGVAPLQGGVFLLFGRFGVMSKTSRIRGAHADSLLTRASKELLRVPLLVRGPGFEPGSSAAVVSLVDVLPTVLTWTGVSIPRGLDGEPLQELWDQHHRNGASCSARRGASIVPSG